MNVIFEVFFGRGISSKKKKNLFLHDPLLPPVTTVMIIGYSLGGYLGDKLLMRLLVVIHL